MKDCTFYVKDFCYTKDTAVSFVPPIQRRKLSTLDKLALASMEKVFTPEIEEIVFASKYGEIDRLNSIISQYQEFGEVSPAQFSGSVHNYTAGFFCILKKLNIPYYAVSAGDDTLRNGLIKAVISTAGNVLFTYADNFAISCIISKTGGEKYAINEFIDFIEAQK